MKHRKDQKYYIFKSKLPHMYAYNEKRIKLFRSLFMAFSIVIFLAIMFLSLSLVFYPGSNIVNELENGYSFLYNTLCDIRGITAVNGEPNLRSSIFIKTSTILVCISMVFFFSILWVFFQTTKTMKYLSWIASILGIFFGPFYLAIIFINAAPEFHMAFDAIAGLTLNISAIIYTILYFLEKRIPKINRYSFLILAISSITYSIIIAISTVIGGEFQGFSHRLGSNLFIPFSLVIFLLQGIGFTLHFWKRE